jgi:uncharacterized protein YndB with AHSA1/START domain
MEPTHFAKAEMLIRRPIEKVFEAFINPAVTTKFWFTKSSGRLEEGKKIEWTWEMYNYTTTVLAKIIEPNKRIVIDWGNYDSTTTVEWTFKELESGTSVSIENTRFQGDAEKVLSQVRDSTEGFTLVLAGLKAYMEHNLELNLVADRFPNP